MPPKTYHTAAVTCFVRDSSITISQKAIDCHLILAEDDLSYVEENFVMVTIISFNLLRSLPTSKRGVAKLFTSAFKKLLAIYNSIVTCQNFTCTV